MYTLTDHIERLRHERLVKEHNDRNIADRPRRKDKRLRTLNKAAEREDRLQTNLIRGFLLHIVSAL